jgi:hypothetical protein
MIVYASWRSHGPPPPPSTLPVFRVFVAYSFFSINHLKFHLPPRRVLSPFHTLLSFSSAGTLLFHSVLRLLSSLLFKQAREFKLYSQRHYHHADLIRRIYRID